MVSVPADLVRYKNLDPVAKYLYLMICHYKPKSVKALAKISGIYRSGVRRHLRDLEASG